jgi:hypothetical protein
MQFSTRKANTLRRAWFGPLSAEEIAKRHQCASAQSLRNFWQREKSAGRLPKNTARPHFEERTTIAPQVALGIDPVDIEFDDPTLDGVDQAPRLPHADPLLLALQREHGHEKIRGINDEMPSQLLMIEAGDEYQRFTPSPSRVREFQRGRDAYVASRMNEKPAPSNCVYARIGRAWWVLCAMSIISAPFLTFEAVQEWGRHRGMIHKGKSA